jgi:hypothetical protein
LTEKRARGLAVKLARKVANDRDAVFWSLSPAVKVRSNRVVFLYSERTPDERFCNAKLVVTQSGRTRHAALAAQRCRPIPEEALAIERATRAAIRSVRPKVPDIRRSLAAHDREAERCAELDPPRAAAEDVELFLEAWLELALYEPILAELDQFAVALEAIDAKDETLAAGIVSWRRWLRLLAAPPAGAREACAELRRWAETGYADDEAPAGFTGLRTWNDAYARQLRRTSRATERLAALGIGARAATAFGPYGLTVIAATR